MARSLTVQNPTTSNTISVVSNAGFNAGDLVYQKNGAVDVIPDGLVTTGTFDINAPVNITNANTNANILSATGGVLGGGSALATPIAAKLSNGNIVYVFISADGSAYFRIADENNTDVVSATLISASSYALEGMICVCALPAGGFAVAFTNSSYQTYHAVYTNTGSVTLAPSLDTTVLSRSMTIAARGSGQGFVLVINDSNTTNTRYKVFSDAGAQTIAWTSVASYYSGSAQMCPAVAVRSDNSFVVGVRTGANIYRYYAYSSTGVAGVNGTINSTYITNTGCPHFSMTCMTTGANVDMIYFLFIEGSANLMVRQTLSATNVLGSETTLFATTACEIQALSTGGYAIAYTDNSTGNLTFRLYNSSNSNTSTTTIPGAAIRASGGFNNFPTVVEMANNYVIAFSFASGFYQNYNTVLTQVNKTTNLVRDFNQVTLTVSSVTSGVNNYSRGVSTPNGAYFISNTTATLSRTISSGSVANIQIASVGCNSVQAKGLPNGNVIVVYATSSTVVASVYTPSGTFVTSFIVASSLTSPYARLCVLSNGKIVIGIGTSNSIVYYVYSSTFSLLTSASQYPTVNGSYIPGGISNSAGFDMAALNSGKFVVGFGNASSQLTYSVITDTLTNVTSNIVVSTYYQNVSVASTPGGSFIISGRQASGQVYLRSFIPTSSSSFTAVNAATGSESNGMTSSPFATQMAMTPQGFAVTPFFSNDTGRLYSYDGSTTSTQLSLYAMQPGLCGVVGVTTMPNGQVLSVYFNTNASSYNWYLHNVNGESSTYSTGSITLSFTPASTPQIQVASLYNNVIAITYLNNSSFPILRIENIASQTYSINVTAGVTPTSVPAYIPSQANGYIFKGVATTSALAGGTGTVQNVGTAQLNSNYSASTAYQAFDSTGTLVQGTKGTIAGRNVNMTGNS